MPSLCANWGIEVQGRWMARARGSVLELGDGTGREPVETTFDSAGQICTQMSGLRAEKGVHECGSWKRRGRGVPACSFPFPR